MNGQNNFIAKLRFFIHKSSSEIANLSQGGVIPGAIRESVKIGIKKFGKAIPLNHIAHCFVYESILSSNKYKSALTTMVRSGSPIQNHEQGEASTNRNYFLYELKL
jgi:hypothetical protein